MERERGTSLLYLEKEPLVCHRLDLFIAENWRYVRLYFFRVMRTVLILVAKPSGKLYEKEKN